MDNICIEIEDNVPISQNVPMSQNVPISQNVFDMDKFIAKQLDYQENYTLPELKKIADYYDISIRKLRKDEVVQEIVLFESDPTNYGTYLKRLQYWDWMKVLKQEPRLKQYILF